MYVTTWSAALVICYEMLRRPLFISKSWTSITDVETRLLEIIINFYRTRLQPKRKVKLHVRQTATAIQARWRITRSLLRRKKLLRIPEAVSQNTSSFRGSTLSLILGSYFKRVFPGNTFLISKFRGFSSVIIFSLSLVSYFYFLRKNWITRNNLINYIFRINLERFFLARFKFCLFQVLADCHFV